MNLSAAGHTPRPGLGCSYGQTWTSSRYHLFVRSMASLVAVPIAGVPLIWRQMVGRLSDGPAADVAWQVWAYAIEWYADAVRRSGGLPQSRQRRHHVAGRSPAGRPNAVSGCIRFRFPGTREAHT